MLHFLYLFSSYSVQCTGFAIQCYISVSMGEMFEVIIASYADCDACYCVFHIPIILSRKPSNNLAKRANKPAAPQIKIETAVFAGYSTIYGGSSFAFILSYSSCNFFRSVYSCAPMFAIA